MVRLFEVSPIIWETVTEELEKKLSDIEFKAKDITPDWRKLAHRRKIDREIFEKYGYFKDIILHPKFQLVKHYYEEHADFNLFVGEPLLPLTTAIILLFILYRKVNANILILIASFLFNINPFYVSLVVFLSWFSVKRKKVPKQHKTVKFVTVASSVPNGSMPSIEQFPFHLTSNDKEYSEFDHIFIGRNISTLYAAALLSKNGHRVCVLELPQSPKSTILPSGAPCAADIEQITVNKLERYQFLLDCVQSRKNPRVQFTPIGRAETGFTHSIITLKHPTQRQKDQTLALRYGPENIAHEVSSIYPINRSTVSAVFQKIRATMGLISHYLYSHVLTNKGDDASRGIRAEYEKDSNFQTINEFVRSSVEKTLYDNQLEQADVINALTGLASTIGCQESCLKNTISSLALGGLINTETGTFVPRHGVSELEAALTHVIYESSGKVFSANQVKGLEIEESAKKDGSSHSSYKVIGVTITNNGKSKGDCLLKANHSVVSGIGLLGSYATLVPSECVSDETKEQLSLLQEKRPKIKVILWLKGEAAELGVTSVNYFEILSSIESVGAGLNTQCGKEHDAAEKLAGSYVHIWSPLAQNPDLTNRNTQIVVVEFEATEPVVRSEVFNWQAESSNVPKGPKFYVSKRDEATNPNHPDYGLTVGGRVLALTGSQKADYQRRAELLLHSLYPRTFGNIIFSHVEEPTLGGYALSNNTAKFASSLSLKTEIENFYLTGEDFAFNGYMGALQGGWLTANAVLGYSVQELSAGKNLFVDLYSLSS